jgi:hypothetical protein
MIPSVVAKQVRETILDYLQTTFALADKDFEQALFGFLDGSKWLFKGSCVDIRLPQTRLADWIFRRASHIFREKALKRGKMCTI